MSPITSPKRSPATGTAVSDVIGGLILQAAHGARSATIELSGYGFLATLPLQSISTLPPHEFWTDDVSYLGLPTAGVLGHRQATDAYLVLPARNHGGTTATMDLALLRFPPASRSSRNAGYPFTRARRAHSASTVTSTSAAANNLNCRNDP